MNAYVYLKMSHKNEAGASVLMAVATVCEMEIL
jgi:hypothetical protein